MSISLFEILLNEAAGQVHAIETVDDLHARMDVQRDRLEVPNDRLQAFIVTIPDGYTPSERARFTKLINEALVPVVSDAMLDIDHQRTWSGFDA